MPALPRPLPAPFGRFWVAEAVSSLGTAVTAVAMPVLVVQVLEASPLEVGVVNAAQFIPYAALGLLVGAYVDRWPRRPTLVWASLGRFASLALIPVLWAVGALSVGALAVLLLAFGAFSVVGFAAAHALLPGIVPRRSLLRANAQLDQADAAAQAAGPAIGGGLVGALGAPVAIALDALTYLAHAILVALVPVRESVERPPARPRLGRDIREGVRRTYRDRVLGPLAVSTHVWFFGNSAALTAVSLYALRELALTPAAFGLLLTVAALTMLAGAWLAPTADRILGAGRTVVVARILYPLAAAAIAAAALAGAGEVVSLILLYAGLAAQGFAGGIENAAEMALRQTLTPDRLLGRVSATMRSANRTAAAVGALVSGAVITVTSTGLTLAAAAVLFAVAAAIVLFSPVRTVRLERD